MATAAIGCGDRSPGGAKTLTRVIGTFTNSLSGCYNNCAARPRRRRSFEKSYRKFMVANLRHVDVGGLATFGFYVPELDDVFVDMSFTLRSPHQVRVYPVIGVSGSSVSRSRLPASGHRT